MSDAAPASPPKIFDRDLIAHRLKSRQGKPDFVTELALEDLAVRLAVTMHSFEKALIIGPDASVLPEVGQSGNGEFSFQRFSTLTDENPIDPENLSLPETDYDLAVSIMDLHTINDVPGYLSGLRRHLRPDGLLLLAAIGGATLGEMRAAWLRADAEIAGGAFARIAPLIEVRDAGMLLQRAGFALPVADVDVQTVRYKSPLSLMQELKTYGASNPLLERPGRMVSKRHLAAASHAYEQIAADDDGRVRATLEILWLSGWAPHESQQKPLKPGSAQVSLTKILGGRSD